MPFANVEVAVVVEIFSTAAERPPVKVEVAVEVAKSDPTFKNPSVEEAANNPCER